MVETTKCFLLLVIAKLPKWAGEGGDFLLSFLLSQTSATKPSHIPSSPVDNPGSFFSLLPLSTELTTLTSLPNSLAPTSFFPDLLPPSGPQEWVLLWLWVSLCPTIIGFGHFPALSNPFVDVSLVELSPFLHLPAKQCFNFDASQEPQHKLC